MSGRNAALERLQNQVSSLADLLNLERQANAELRANAARLSDELNASISIRSKLSEEIMVLELQAGKADKLATSLREKLEASLANIGENKTTIANQLTLITSLRDDVDSLKALREELEKKVAGLLGKVSNRDELLSAEKKISQTARARLALLTCRNSKSHYKQNPQKY